MDMSPAYRETVSAHLPKAKIVFDRLHVVRLFNEKPSDLRRALHREATDLIQKRVLEVTRWLLLKASEDLDEEKDEREKLEEALPPIQSLAVAYNLKSEWPVGLPRRDDHLGPDGGDQQQDQDHEALSLWVPEPEVLQVEDPGDPRDRVRTHRITGSSRLGRWRALPPDEP
jgi:Transposase